MSCFSPAKVVRCCIIAALVAATPLVVKGEGLRYGIQISAAEFTRNLSSGVDPGFGLTFFMELRLGAKSAARSRFEFIKYTEISSISVCADYMYMPSGNDRGLYGFAGVGIVDTVVDEFPLASLLLVLGTQFGFTAGVGCNFTRNIGAEARYVTDINGLFNTLHFSICYRF